MYLKIKDKNIKIIEAITFKERLNGLMGKTNIDYGMLFKKCNSIHTFFMKENIDIIGLNTDNDIIYIYNNLPKNQIIKINNNINKTSILELPVNYSSQFKLGEKLEFKKDNH